MFQEALIDLADLKRRLEALEQENARLHERLERRARRDLVLNRINSRIRTSLNDMPTVLQTAVEELGRSLDAVRCWVLLYRSEGIEPEWFEYTVADALPRPAFYGSDSSLYVAPPGLMACPMMLQHEVFGFILAHRPARPEWSPADVELVEQVAGELAIALDNARLMAEGDRRAREIEQLLSVARTANEERNPHRLIERLAEQAMAMIGAQGAAVGLVVGDEVVVDRVYRAGRWESVEFRFTPGQGVPGWVLVHKRPYLSHDASRDSLVDAGFSRRFQLRALLCVPIVGRQGHIHGVIELHNRAGDGLFADRDIERAQVIAQQTALALENARLFEDVQRRAAMLEMLLTFGEDLNYQIEPTLLIRRVIERAVALVGARGGLGGLMIDSIMHCDGYWHAARGEWQASDYRWPAGRGLAGWVMENKRPYVTNDYQRDKQADPALVEAFDLRSAVCVPLRDAEDAMLGFFEVHDKADRRALFSWADVAILESLANMAAVAIGNARLFRELEAQRAQLRTLSNQLVQAMEAERRRIARELHDEAGQLLYGLRLQLDVLARNVPPDHTDLLSQADAMRELIEEARHKIRKLSHELRPATLDELGLVPALRRLVNDFGGEAGLTASFDSSLDERLAPQIETACYRIVQEALTNVVRHAQARNVVVSLEADDRQVRLTIEDDGRGFDRRQAHAKGVGLLGIRERVAGLVGEVVIDSALSRGTRLEVTLPVVPARE